MMPFQLGLVRFNGRSNNSSKQVIQFFRAGSKRLAKFSRKVDFVARIHVADSIHGTGFQSR